MLKKTTQASHSSVFEWLGLEPNNYEPSEIRTRSVFEPPLYYISSCIPLRTQPSHVDKKSQENPKYLPLINLYEKNAFKHLFAWSVFVS